MSRLKVLSIFGTRPEAIKMAPVVAALDAAPEMDHSVCVTGQHREMLDQVLEFFGIVPAYDLDVMQQARNLAEVTGEVVTRVYDLLGGLAPDLVLVQGDTNTTFSAALAAYYRRTDVGHVEAGLRTGDIYMPWPEEVSRKLVAGIAALNFAPTETNRQNLLREGVDSTKITVTGNTVIDALFLARDRLSADAALTAQFESEFAYLDPGRKLILVTGHRRENFGERFRDICTALRRIAERGDCEILYPVHLNPNVRAPVNEILKGRGHIHLIEPTDYPRFVYLMDRAYLILTDSGGIQEEAPSLGKPVFVMRETTERPEAVAAGTVRIVGTGADAITAAVAELIDDKVAYRAMSRAANPFGDGHAAERTVGAILEWAKRRESAPSHSGAA